MSLLEKYAAEAMAGIVALMMSWTCWTTYNNVIMLTRIEASVNVYGETLVHLTGSMNSLERVINGIDKRLSKVENTRWSEADQKEFKDWVQRQLDSKVNK